MWKFSRNLFHTRWCTSNPIGVKHPAQNAVSISHINSHPSFEKKKSSGKGNEKEENFSNHSERYWNSSHFRYLLYHSSFFETAGWLGTVSILCFNVHFRHLNFAQYHERRHSRCLFTKSALAMPDGQSKQQEIKPSSSFPRVGLLPEKTESSNVYEGTSVLGEMREKSIVYAAALQNSMGISYSESNNKKAFRCFQRAARLGSSQGFYNLGLCYELGRGTKVNLERAAFCYRKAAMKGHGMASFNLALYFLRGTGSLPEDPETAHLLLEQAAAKGVTQAELYLGLECLECSRWSEAYTIFNSLAERNDIDGKYYLGLCFENGWGVKKDEKTAVKIYSQNSDSGHDKSTLSLSRCYEEGRGGCDTNEEFALALCQTLKDKGCEEAKNVISRLQRKIEDAKILKKPSSPVDPKKHTMHPSSSDPEFRAVTHVPSAVHLTSIISSYLDLVQGFLPRMSHEKKVSFYVEEHESNLGRSVPLVQNNYVVPAGT